MAVALCIVGPLPPPRHGVSAVNEAVLALATSEGFSVTCLNTAPASLERSIKVRVRRLVNVIKAIGGVGRFTCQYSHAAVYLSLSGGWGLAYEAVIAWRAKRAGARIVVHHHSFRYLDGPFWPMRILVKAAGPQAVHVVLGGLMAERLRARYPAVGPVMVMSNAQFIIGEGKASEKLRTVGYLSNLSAAKGLDDVLAAAESSLGRGWPLQFIIAGPFENPADNAKYTRRMKSLGNVRYLGAVQGAAKEEFFLGIDAFLFPTRYRHEAEPLVVLEALSYGRPVIAYARGCIPSVLAKGGHVVPCDEDFVAQALGKLESWMDDDRQFEEIGMAAGQRLAELKAQSLAARQELLGWFTKA